MGQIGALRIDPAVVVAPAPAPPAVVAVVVVVVVAAVVVVVVVVVAVVVVAAVIAMTCTNEASTAAPPIFMVIIDWFINHTRDWKDVRCLVARHHRRCSYVSRMTFVLIHLPQNPNRVVLAQIGA